MKKFDWIEANNPEYEEHTITAGEYSGTVYYDDHSDPGNPGWCYKVYGPDGSIAEDICDRLEEGKQIIEGIINKNTKGDEEMKKLVLVDSMEDSEVWAVEGYTLGDPAVRVNWGYATGSESGVHNVANTFAIAELGKVAEGGFESVVWTEENFGKEILTRRVMGWPQEYEGWDPEDMEDVDWDAMAEWVEDYCQRVL